MLRRFDKMHGLGNDFVVIDAREQPLAMTAQMARAICDRRTGIGCDQLILLEPSTAANLRMRIWNQDGGEVESCGNATRCVIALTEASSIETGGGILTGEAIGAEVEVAMGEPRFGWEEIPLAYAMDTNPLPLGWDGLERPIAVNVGNPHLVFFVESIDSLPLDRIGPAIETDPAFPERINVNVAAIAEGEIRLRTWERGAGLTHACGTGACATGVAAILTRRVQGPVNVVMSGGSLLISWAPGSPIMMRGPATHVFSGKINLETLGG